MKTPSIPTSPAPLWNKQLLEKPHDVADKRQRVQGMFTAIAPSYDLNNRVHSLWMDQRWRKQAVKLANPTPGDTILDVACGTGDLTLAFAAALRSPSPSANSTVIGLDFTFAMLPHASAKAHPTPHPIPRFINGDAQSLPLANASADVLSIAFGIRNVQDPAAAVREFHRVLRPGGRLIVLEFSLPTNPILRALYNVYFRQILPRTATLLSRDKTGAYRYLPESVNTFITPAAMQTMMSDSGFTQVTQHPMTFGVAIAYRGIKP